MLKTSEKKARIRKTIAHHLRIQDSEIDTDLLRSALRAVRNEDTDYHDAFSNVGQIPGNVPESVSVAIVYGFLDS